MGDTGSIFDHNSDDEGEDSKESLVRAMRRVKDEDAMSTTSNEELGETWDEAPVKMAAYGEDEEEPMEEDD